MSNESIKNRKCDSDTESESLADFVEKHTSNNHLRIQDDLGDGFYRLRATEAQRRQAAQDIRCNEDIVIEMLRNSRDAGAKNIFLATNSSDNTRYIVVIDDGSGVDKIHHKEIFEPYVTSKLNTIEYDMFGVHGRGMALYSISLNTERSYVCRSAINSGCSIKVVSKADKLKEKKDQSTFPSFSVSEDKELVITGPRNIIRACCEFAVESRDKVNVFVGSSTEIAATLYKNSKCLSNTIFEAPDDETPCVDILGYATDPEDFCNIAQNIGLEMSARSARRIMDGQIKPIDNLLEIIANEGISGFDSDSKHQQPLDVKSPGKTHLQPKNTIKINRQDKAEFADDIKASFNKIADKYYLNHNIDPSINIKGNTIYIKFNIDNDSTS